MKNVYDTVAAVGMDVHYRFTATTMRDDQGHVVRRERLEHSDLKALRERLAAWPRNVPMVMEASFGWGWLADLMTELGLRPELSNCYKLEQMRKARGQSKTNKKDADLLSLLPFERSAWWKVWMAPPEVRDLRELMRYRSGLVAVQTETKCRIAALFHRHGIVHDYSDLFGVSGRRFQAEICRTGGTADVRLSPGCLAALRGLTEMLQHVRGQLAGVARELHGRLERSPLARRLDGIPGVGLILAHTLMSEIGRIERFSGHRALASYSLLAPISRDTGEDDGGAPIGRRLGHRGNRTLKWALIEAARGAVRSGGRWRAMYNHHTEGGTKDRNRGYIKVARELVKVVYVVWSKDVEYAEQPPARPGSDLAGRGSRRSAREFLGVVSDVPRSGTGQPDRPMAVVRQDGRTSM